MDYKTLFELLNRLESNPNASLKGLTLYHSSVSYAVAAVKALYNIDVTLEKMANLMVEEGLLGSNGKPIELRALKTSL